MNSTNTKNNTRTFLLREWEEISRVAKSAFCEEFNTWFIKSRQKVLHLFTTHSIQFARLNDETVYSKLLELMGVYRKIVLEARIEIGLSPNAKELIDGICEVLTSRLSQFFAKCPSGLGSPVRVEKISIIENALLVFLEKFVHEETAQPDQIIQRKAKSRTLPSSQSVAAKWQHEKQNTEVALSQFIKKMYEIYTEELLNCLSSLDDLHSRKVAGFFMDLLEREWEELGNIIKVQVGALEEYIKDSGAAIPVANVLGMLREVYQNLGPVIEDYKKLLTSQRAHPKDFISFRDFSVCFGELAAEIKSDTDNFTKLLNEEVKKEAEKLLSGFSKAAYNVKRMASGDIFLAGEIKQIFLNLFERLKYLEENAGNQILSGICETIEIKIASLAESISDFEDSSEKLIKEAGQMAQTFVFPGELIERVQGAVFVGWQNSTPDEDSVDVFFEKCLGGSEFLPLREHMDKMVGNLIQKVEKSLLGFKREVLLYEICTFEEIITYSAVKLEASEDESVVSAAHLLKDVFKEIETILKKNYITVIRPSVRSEFNPREHEVLVAEKHEGFNKGQIIKVLTAGYYYKDSVILRANVVAAR